ncbi:MAG: ABC transporter ATP-binding protein [Candidatus Hydrogenedentes bacterium]|nr:ABC transporter ATP-binding protein [Candidatus Hydrogenedentota bacterium]
MSSNKPDTEHGRKPVQAKNGAPIIEVRDLVTRYGETTVLDGISCAVRPGEIFVIIGGSGSGKTTLLKHMCGLLQPAAGEIVYRGQDITRMDEDELAQMQRSIGIAFQSSGLFNSMTVGDNVALPLREYGEVDNSLIPDVVRMKLSLVGLADAENKLPSELSGGMRKRAGLARAIALDPPLVYFDEPSAGIDPIMASGLDDLILDLNRLLGTTFVIVTHELDSIRKVAHRILMLDRGKVIFLGTMEEADHTDVERVRQFFERRPDEFIAHRNIA